MLLLERLIAAREDAERDRDQQGLLPLTIELARALGQQDVVDALTGGRR